MSHNSAAYKRLSQLQTKAIEILQEVKIETDNFFKDGDTPDIKLPLYKSKDNITDDKNTEVDLFKNDEKNAVKKNVGENIRIFREKQKISLEDLAAKLDLSSDFLGSAEQGRCSLSIHSLYKLSGIFNMPVDVFFQPPCVEMQEENADVSET